MNRFTLLCTKEQVKKALELGAPIVELPLRSEFTLDTCDKYGFIHLNNTYYVIPTSEQMLGWLEEEQYLQIIFPVSCCNTWGFGIYNIDLPPREQNVRHENCVSFKTRKEATLAAIDAALEYLTNKK